MLKHLDCAYKIKEFASKYKGIFYSGVLEQAINNYYLYEKSQELIGENAVIRNSERQ